MLRQLVVCFFVLGQFATIPAEEKEVDMEELAMKKERIKLGKRMLGSMLWDKDKTVWMRGGRVIVDRAFLQGRKKRMWVMMIKSYIELLQQSAAVDRSSADEASDESSPQKSRKKNKRGLDLEKDPLAMMNLVYLMDASASGPSSGSCSRAGLAPIWAIAKTKSDDQQCGQLVPNPYFGDLRIWALETERLEALANQKAWSARDQRVFWRGVIRHMQCRDDRGNYARLQAASLSHLWPNDFDVRCTRCSPRDDTTLPCPGLHYGLLEQATIEAMQPVDPVGHDAYINYKFVLNLPGSTTGSYSRNLNHLWALGSVVLLWDVGGVEWYDDSLKNGQTHLLVNQTTIRPAIQRVLHDPDLANTLIQGAKSVQRDYISLAGLRRELDLFFRQYRLLFSIHGSSRAHHSHKRNRQYIPAIFDDEDTLKTALKNSPLKNDCSDLDLVQIDIRHTLSVDALRRLSLAELRDYQERTNATVFRPLSLPDIKPGDPVPCDRLLFEEGALGQHHHPGLITSR